jgi:hypothetical protein
MLHRLPEGDMPLFSLTEDSIQETCSAEKAHMAAMQWCDWPTNRAALLSQQ